MGLWLADLVLADFTPEDTNYRRIYMSVAVMTDTNSGLTPAQAKELGVYLLPMPILIDGNAYYEHQSITPKEFYEKMRAKADISTTQPSPADLMDLWEEILRTHDEVVHIPMSSGLSGSHETAAGFAREFNGRVHVVDNHRISVTMRQSSFSVQHINVSVT